MEADSIDERDNPRDDGSRVCDFESDESFRLLVQCVKDYAIVKLDVNGYVRSWNDGAMRIKGYLAEEIIGNHFSCFYSPEDVASGKPASELQIALRKGRCEDESWRIHKDGSRFLAHRVITTIRDSQGHLQGYSEITSNITERRETERQLIELADALRKSEETDVDRLKQLNLKDEFLSHVSHELRSPLASIHSFVNILVDGLAGATNPKQDQYLAIVLKNVHQLQSMIEDLLEVTKGETGMLAFEAHPTSAIDAAQYAIHSARSYAVTKAVDLSLDAAHDLPQAYVDATRLQQILTILLDNAIKFTPLNGQVRVTLTVRKSSPFETGGEFVLVEVCDTGCGMTPESTERIFERLYQVPKRHQQGRRGLGLGLYIARELIMRMGGRIWVESVLKHGSRFFFTLPVFSLEALVSPVLSQEFKAGHGALLFWVNVMTCDEFLIMSENGLKEIRKVLRECLRPDSDVLLPDIGSTRCPELVFVVSFSKLEGVSVIEERILASLGRNAPLQEEGLRFSVDHVLLTTMPGESSPLSKDYLRRISAEIQDQVDDLSKRRSKTS